MGHDLTGHVAPDRTFPILTKLIDAHEVLSVQVHPDDRWAQELEGEANGKTECWYVIAAEPGSTLTYGFSRDVTPDEYAQLVREGRLDEVLRSLTVQPGDVLYIPAGTVHAIGAGVLVFELQQTSDVTYRIYDWNRRDASGKTRELHVDKARQVLDYHGAQRGLVHPLTDSNGRSVLVAGPYFTLSLLEAPTELSTENSPVAVCALDSPLRVAAAGSAVELPRYSSLLVPAVAGGVSIQGSDGNGRCLVATIPASETATREDLLGRGFSEEDMESFLAQFAPVGDLGMPPAD
jgi:mannose-6-phosphate isomerase